ncbi:homeobox protein unc-62-like isoform X2 [Artemia franciscana]|uniref:Homeobox domain-containing protein n=1 Tax=Artemia franciscana TaxID=6661 RepID=A0AA88HU43_ARTSF|nr:hypothetical protein QYM36_012108 [Artemia franciscana]KAK2710812.1 hypothetical protein QYM36_012108 [Artemia franciscana]
MGETNEALEIGRMVANIHDNFRESNVEEEKKAIYGHPLFPLLAVLLEKCEIATVSNKAVNKDVGTFEEDVRTFIDHNTKGNQRLLIPLSDTTDLMVHALQVLQIHLMELQKVRDLCNEFCTRYVSNMKSKLAPEKLIGSVTEEELTLSLHEELFDRQSFDSEGNGIDYSSSIYQRSNSYGQDHRTSRYGLSDSCSRSDDDRCDESPPLVIAEQELDLSKDRTSIGRTDSDDSQSTPHLSGKKPGKGCRGALPKQATAMLKEWIWQHKDRPYPTEEEKRMLAERGNITVHQINNWFINARRRILQPHISGRLRDTQLCKGESVTKQKLKSEMWEHQGETNSPGLLYQMHNAGYPSHGLFMNNGKES